MKKVKIEKIEKNPNFQEISEKNTPYGQKKKISLGGTFFCFSKKTRRGSEKSKFCMKK